MRTTKTKKARDEVRRRRRGRAAAARDVAERAKEVEDFGHQMLKDMHGNVPDGEAPEGTIAMVLFFNPTSGTAHWRIGMSIGDTVCGRKGPAEAILQASRMLIAEAKRCAVPCGIVH